MGYDYSLSTDNYFRFIPASYGIMNAIHGTSDDLRAIDLDSMVLSGYNVASYYNHLNNINSRTSGLFSIISNGGQGVNPGRSVNPTKPSEQTQPKEGTKTGDDVEQAEYDSKLGFIENLIKSEKLSGYSKTIAKIKKDDMTYEEAIAKLDAILEDIHTNHGAALENYANIIAKARYVNTQDGTSMGLASEAINEIGSWYRRDMSSTQLDDLLSRLSNLNESNILDFIREYESLSSKNIIQQIQEKMPKNKQIKVDGKRVQRRLERQFGGFMNWGWGKDRQLNRQNEFYNKMDCIIKTVGMALVAKAEQYEDSMNQQEIANLEALRGALRGGKLLHNTSLGTCFNAVYNDIKDMDAKIANRKAKEEVEAYLPAGCTVNVTGAKTRRNRPIDPVGNVPSSQTFGVYAN